MTYTELIKRVEMLENRLEIKEAALNEALKTIESIENYQPKKKRKSLSSYIDDNKFDDAFGFCYDKKTGALCAADQNKKTKNFRNLHTNVMMACGYTFPALVHGEYHAKVKPLTELTDNEYEQFGILLNEIVELIYEFKEREK